MFTHYIAHLRSPVKFTFNHFSSFMPLIFIETCSLTLSISSSSFKLELSLNTKSISILSSLPILLTLVIEFSKLYSSSISLTIVYILSLISLLALLLTISLKLLINVFTGSFINIADVIITIKRIYISC